MNRISKLFLPFACSLLLTASVRMIRGQTVPARIAFQSLVTVNTKKQSVSYNQIFSMNPDGSGVSQLTTAAANSMYPTWSPGQQYIAFNRNSTLWIMDSVGEASGGHSSPVIPARSFGMDWSPDGTKIVYTGTSTALGLTIVSVNTSTGQAGTPTLVRSGEVYWPAWSPDGSRIAFCSSYDGGTTQVIIVLDLATLAEISFGVGPVGSYDFQPAWKPDASQIAFTGPVTTVVTSRNGRQSSTYYNQIFIANADGTGITQITNLGRDCLRPCWSSDATTLAFSSSGIYKMPLNTRILTLLSASGNDPDWTP